MKYIFFIIPFCCWCFNFWEVSCKYIECAFYFNPLWPKQIQQKKVQSKKYYLIKFLVNIENSIFINNIIYYSHKEKTNTNYYVKSHKSIISTQKKYKWLYFILYSYIRYLYLKIKLIEYIITEIIDRKMVSKQWKLTL